MPYMKSKSLRLKNIAVPCTPEEMQMFRKLARDNNLALATYIRVMLHEKLNAQKQAAA